MKRQSLAYFFTLPALLLALSALAHEPAKHINEAPDCAAIKDMDHSKMDMKDPVMQAMMQKCMEALHPDAEDSHEADAENGKHDNKPDAKKPTNNQH